MMLLAKAFIKFLIRWESGDLDRDQIPDDLLREKIPVILFDILLKALGSHEDDGSWSHQHEPTAYAILTLVALRSLPWIDSLTPMIQSRIDQGREYLLRSQDNWEKGDPIGIETTTGSVIGREGVIQKDIVGTENEVRITATGTVSARIGTAGVNATMQWKTAPMTA